MKLGLYQLKYPARKLLMWLLPLVKDVSPNQVSLWMLPVGFFIAFFSYVGFTGLPIFLLFALILCLLRMILGTLDGLMAVHFNKQSPTGEILNRLAPELCDIMYLVALILVRPDLTILGLAMLCFGWLTCFSGLLGLVIGRPIQSVGPVGQTDRLAAFMVILLLQYWFVSVDFVQIFMWWCVIGGLITVSIRLWRTLNVPS